MKQRGLFVIGTDTDVGKTFVTALLGGLLQNTKESIGLLKPVASGAKTDAQGHLYSEDCQELMRLSKLPEEMTNQVNPIRIPGEFSPKIAAEKLGIHIDMMALKSIIRSTVNKHDYTLIEGAGGITTPFTEDYRLDQLVQELEYPVLLVCDGRLGSINRVLLTVAFIRQLGIPLIGIIVNDMDSTEDFLLKTNCSDMELYTKLPILGVLKAYQGPKNVDHELAWAAEYLDVEKFIQAWEAVYHEK